MVDLDISPAIETERLRLRAPQRRDAERIAMLANDLDVARMTTKMPHPYALADAEAFLAQAEGHDPARERAFAIEAPGEGLVGMLGFHPRAEDGRPELGYWLGRAYWGRGYATEAARASLRWAARAWRRRMVVAGHFSDNAASGQVLCKAGFLYTGEVKLQHCLARGEQTPTRMMIWLA